MNGQRIPLIGQQPAIGHAANEGPLAFPAVMPMNTPNGPVVFSFGGLTKLEYGALLIASTCPYAEEAVRRAKEVLAECKKQEPAEV